MNKWTKISSCNGLYLNANGRYYIRRSSPDRSFHSLKTTNLREAKLRLKALMSSNYCAPQETNKTIKTFGALTDEFAKNEIDRLTITTKSRKRIIHSIRYLKQAKSIWQTEITNIRTRPIRKTLDQIPTLSNASKNYLVCTVNKVIEYGVEQGLIVEGSCEKLKSFSVEPRKINLPNDTEFKELVETLRTSENWINNSEITFTFLFLCFTGLRMGEAKAIRWSNIKSDHIVVEGTKTTAAHRILPIWGQLRELLDNIKEYRGSVSEDDFVIKRKRIDKALRIACKKVGVEYLRHHDLRHYFATKAIQSGVDIPTVSKWLGHADGGALAMKVYTNLMTDHLIEQSKKLKFAGGLMEPA
jgi:integrase